jgi:hypothetical protein
MATDSADAEQFLEHAGQGDSEPTSRLLDRHRQRLQRAAAVRWTAGWPPGRTRPTRSRKPWRSRTATTSAAASTA